MNKTNSNPLIFLDNKKGLSLIQKGPQNVSIATLIDIFLISKFSNHPK